MLRATIIFVIAAIFMIRLDSVINALLNFLFEFTLSRSSLLILMVEVHPLIFNQYFKISQIFLALLPEISSSFLMGKDVVILI